MLHFTGKMHEEFTHFSVRDTILETLDIIRGTTNSRIEVKTRVDHHLGTLFGDPVHMQQILMNLTNNAIHALSDTEKPCIEISAVAYDDQQMDIMITDPESMLVVISVSDNGPGVPEEDLPKLCEPFFTTKPRDEGTGLGLFVTQKIVKTLRGKLLFSRNQSGGTTARVCLPANRGRIPDCEECLTTPGHTGQCGTHPGHRITPRGARLHQLLPDQTRISGPPGRNAGAGAAVSCRRSPWVLTSS